MTPHLEQRFRKAYPSVCQIVLRRLVEWKWGRVMPFAHLCAGLAYYPRCCSFAGFRCISCNLYAFWPYLQGFRGAVDDGDKWALFLLPNICPPSIPGSLSVSVSSSRTLRVGALSLWVNIPGLCSGLFPWLWIHRLKWAFLYYLYFGGFLVVVGFFGGFGGGGTPSLPLLLPPFFILTKNTGNKKRARLGPFLSRWRGCLVVVCVPFNYSQGLVSGCVWFTRWGVIPGFLVFLF